MADGLLIGLALLAGVVLGPPALLVVPGATAILMWLRGAWSWARLGLAILVVAVGVVRSAMVDGPVSVPELEASTRAVGVVDSLPIAGGASERAVLRIEAIGAREGSLRPASGRILIFIDDTVTLGPGDRVSVTWSVTARESAPPGYAAFLASQDASGSARVWTHRVLERGPGWRRSLADVRRSIASTLQLALPGDAGALAAGIVTGDDAGLSDATEDAFRRTGTAHITAVSGQNIGLLLAFCALWMRPSGQSTRVAAHVAMLALVWSYALMVGLEAPALRAAIVASLTIAGTYSGRRPDPLTLLGLTLGGMALLDPRLTLGAGFWLSASASMALCSVMRVDVVPSLGGFLRQSGFSVLAANIATLPILIGTFGEWSPVSPLANLLIGPLMTLTFPATYVLALVTMAWAGAGDYLAWLPGIGLDACLAIVHRVAGIAPLLRLDLSPRAVVLTVGVPCALALATMSRDGARWVRHWERRWESDWRAVAWALAGAGIGITVALVAGVPG